MSGMLFVLQRALTLFVVLFGASVLVFGMMRLLPGDPALAMLGFMASEEALAAARVELGLDQNIFIQYRIWIGNALAGDLGNSILMRTPVLDLIGGRFRVTLVLGIAAMVVALLVAVPAGVLAARWSRGFPDHVFRVVALTGVSMPNFWVGLLLIMLFAVTLNWLPPGGYISPSENLLGSLRSLVLPAIALGTAAAASLSRMLRATMIDALSREHIMVARSLGVPERTLIWGDAFRNAILPTINVTGVVFGYLLAGTVLTETIFNIPGIGRLLYEAILNRDYPLVQGVVLFSVAVFILVNLTVDIIQLLLDPRMRAA